MKTFKKIALWLVILMGSFFLTFTLLIIVMTATLGGLVSNEALVENESVAIIEIDDAISDTSKTLKYLYETADNPKIAGIVVRVDSPGGSVGPSQELYSAIKRLKEKKKIVVSMGSVAASGGLYLALAADKIFCQPGTLTGSIGVIMQTPNISAIADKVGFQMTTVKSGKLKDVGNPFRPMESGEKEFLNSVIQTTYDQFVTAVWEGREKRFNELGVTREKMLEFADGRIIPGSIAKEIGLVDDFGDIYDAARAVLELNNTPIAGHKLPTLTYPGRKLVPWRELFEASAKSLSIFSKQWATGGVRVSYLAQVW